MYNLHLRHQKRNHFRFGIALQKNSSHTFWMISWEICLKSFPDKFVWKKFVIFLDCFYLQKMISWEMCLKSFLDKFVRKEFVIFLDCCDFQKKTKSYFSNHFSKHVCQVISPKFCLKRIPSLPGLLLFTKNDFLRNVSQIISRQVCLKGISSLPGMFSFAENDFSKHVSQVSSPKVSLHGISYLPGLFSLW